MTGNRTAAQRPSGGFDESGAHAWLGIPFAYIGRFEPPRLLPFEEGDYKAFGPAPFQIEAPAQPLGAEPEEDSAFLNVWAPQVPSPDALPVIVTVYGGGFEHGAGSSWPAHGAALASTGRVIVVSFNYRVGALGFVTMSAVDARFPAASNLGLRDAITALKWVRENIRRFGGDPEQVTVVGESAGGFIAAALAAAPSADGLYTRLAVHSAGASRIIEASLAKTMAQAFVAALEGIGISDVAAAEPLDLVRAQGEIVATDIGVRNGPAPRALGVVNDAELANPVLNGHPAEAFRSGRVAHVPLLVSATRDEIAMFRAGNPSAFDPESADAIVTEVTHYGVSREQARAVVDAFQEPEGGDNSPGAVRARMLTDYIYRLPSLRLAQEHAAAGGDAHLFLVGRADDQPAGHACDVAGLIGTHWPNSTQAADRRDEEITGIILDFATGEALPWPAVAAGSVAAHHVGEVDEAATNTFERIAEIWQGISRP